MLSSTRVVFHAPSQSEFTTLLGKIPLSAGGGIENIQFAKFAPPTRLHQRGGGFFSSLANIAKSAAPFLFRAIAPTAIKFTKDVIHDVGSGRRGLRNSLKRRGIEALRGVGSKVMKGGGKRRGHRLTKTKTTKQNKKKKEKRKTYICNKKNIKDVFDVI